MIAGREREKALLNKALLSKTSEFIVVYGRRRIGKTYLIREFFKQKPGIFFHVTGAYLEKKKVQLQRFADELSKIFFDNAPLDISSWDDAFKLLQQQIVKHANKKIIIFLDELPWLATRRSGLLSLIDYYWNHYWSSAQNVILIACGSSASWLVKNIIYNKGGLHNRVTGEIHLKPFNLNETASYLKSRKVKLTQQHILSLYMALGGVPYYLSYVESGLTSDQIIQDLLFSVHSPLKDELTKLFHSLFENAETYLELIEIVAKNKSGVIRSDIAAKAKLSGSGGRLSKRLQDLCLAGFLEERLSWDKKLGEYYKLIDEFTLFQLHWVNSSKKTRLPKNYWTTMSQTQAYKVWSGYAFENICMKHIDQVMQSLNIPVVKAIHSWRYIPKKHLEEGAQIDLLIDRLDDAITVCEIKYTAEPFYLDKQYAKKLQQKLDTFQARTKSKKQLFLALITANGIKPSMYSEEMITGVVTLKDLFKGDS